ncbi:MAG: AAA domain-containing protein [Monoraphidium minutum]|nr:MAG: AAA domain-containing protein [Monoraphidium minutum]
MDASGATNRLHEIVLAWDYFRLWARQEQGLGVFDSLKAVPDTFDSIEEYKAVFEQLLLEEAGALVLRGVEEGELLEPHPSAVARSEKARARAGRFQVVTVVVNEEVGRKIMDNDLMLLSKENPSDASVNHQLHALAHVEGREGPTRLRLRALLDDDSQAGSGEGLQRVRAVRVGLETAGSSWWLQRLFNTSTLTREWVALRHAHLMPFADSLLRGAASGRRAAPVDLDIPPGMRAAMEQQCNGSQMSALQAGLDGTPLVLIQGPPGTGKTSTILGLLSVVMHAAAKGSLELMPIAGGADGAGAPPADGAAAAAAAAAAASKAEGAAAAVAACGSGAAGGAERRAWLWRLQSPWQFEVPSRRDSVKPWPLPTPEESSECFGLTRAPPAARIGTRSGPRAHVLVCAPSNSALDEIVLRVMRAGLMDGGGGPFQPPIVRVGVNAHHSVAAVSLEALVAARLGSGADGGGKSQVPAHLRDKLRSAIISEASIVFSTLSFAGSSLFHRMGRHFDVVVIDEAAQAVEPSVLVPLVMGCKQVYLVGDPVQLPATVISTIAAAQGYEQSMFKRLMAAGYPVHMLEVQYRMHPSVSLFPNKQFYGGRLVDGEGVEARTTRPWHALRCFGPFAFYDVRGREAVPEGSASLVNTDEAGFVLQLFRHMMRHIPDVKSGVLSVAVISPYKAQVKRLRELFKEALGEELARSVDVNTIDGFQGREKDIVIFSCVRSNDGRRRKGIGFVADERRINVGLTRARCALLVVGNARSLSTDERWRNLVDSALVRGMAWRAAKPYDEFIGQACTPLLAVAGEAAPMPDTKASRDRLGLSGAAAAAAAAAADAAEAGAALDPSAPAPADVGHFGEDVLADDYFGDFDDAPAAAGGGAAGGGGAGGEGRQGGAKGKAAAAAAPAAAAPAAAEEPGSSGKKKRGGGGAAGAAAGGSKRARR